MRVIGQGCTGALDQPSHNGRCRFHADLLADYCTHDQLEAGPRAGYAQPRHGSRQRCEPRIAAKMSGDGRRVGLKVEHARKVFSNWFRLTARRAFQRCDETRFAGVACHAERARIAEPLDCTAIRTVFHRFDAKRRTPREKSQHAGPIVGFDVG